MPTALRIGPYRLFFYSADAGEPLHIHVQRENLSAKFWLDPVRLEWSAGFSAAELRRVEKMVQENQARLLESWNEYFGN